ncbi:MAG: DUF721 domain-containing protein [Rhodothermia bacterium]
MKRGSRPRPLGDIMKELLKNLGPGTRLFEASVIAAWQDISGRQIRKATERVWLEKRRLFVKVSSASWRQELHLQRRAWCDRLNQELGRDVVDEIIFR